jgi:hypothetical protein
MGSTTGCKTLILHQALTAGSLRGSDAVLTSAFYEHTTDIGWYQMCLGRVSKKWASTVVQSPQPSPPRDGGLNWSSFHCGTLAILSSTMEPSE